MPHGALTDDISRLKQFTPAVIRASHERPQSSFDEWKLLRLGNAGADTFHGLAMILRRQLRNGKFAAGRKEFGHGSAIRTRSPRGGSPSHALPFDFSFRPGVAEFLE